MRPKGFFTFECRNPDGSLAWKEQVPNGTTTAGLNDILNVYFNSGTQKTTWYMGLIDNSGFSSLSGADTMASHGGWSENTNYAAGTRPTWVPSAASGGSMTNPSATAFGINATVAIKGAFIVSDSTKGGTGGLLWATGAFGGVQSLTTGQVLSVTYTEPLTAV